MPKKLIIANWKMHLGDKEGILHAQSLIKKLALVPAAKLPQIILCPPYTVLREIKAILPPEVFLGAQNCSAFADGPYTGEVSATMIRDSGALYIILGHSERRHFFHETNILVNQKAHQAEKVGLIPIICVGETKEERENDRAHEVVEAQILESCAGLNHFIIAYEPIWAIGSGAIPSREVIETMHTKIALAITAHTASGKAPILYGGSVTAENIADILSISGVDGVLVGGACLTLERFWPLVIG